MSMIIDAHCHYGTGDGLNGPWDTRAPLKDYLQWCKEYKISRTCVFAALGNSYETGNRQVADLIKKHPDRFYGFLFLHAEMDRISVRTKILEAKKMGFCGIKVHRHDAPITREICEIAKEFQLPILYDVMGLIDQVHLLAREYPEVNFIIPHLGTYADNWRDQLFFIDALERYPNIFTDNSGVRRFDLLKEAFLRAGAHKFIFGSDGPWHHPGVELEKIKALTNNVEQFNLITSLNFLRLIGVDKTI